MGRKPNQLILEFFERGAKLEDNSNRYAHTCRACGERFPKGRIDSLTNHLIKKCPMISLEDRQRALFQVHDFPPDLASQAITRNMPFMSDPAQSMGDPRRIVDLPFAPKPGMSALETLAEVSRQHLDLSDRRTPTPVDGQGLRRQSTRSSGGGIRPRFTADDLLVDFDRQDSYGEGTQAGMPAESWLNPSYMPDAPPVSSAPDVGSGSVMAPMYNFGQPSSPSQAAQMLQSAQPQQQSSQPPRSPHVQGQSLPQASAPTAQMMSSLAASAANELQNRLNSGSIQMETDQSHTTFNDQFFQQSQTGHHQSISTPQINIDPMLQEPSGNAQAQGQAQGQDSLQHRAANYPRLIAPNSAHPVFPQGYDLNGKPGKSKVRGRFSDTRRKEVQEVRKRGACLRCRMLKKSCSEGTPCNTCKSVESARLWKSPCIRTRLAEEFNIWASGLQGVIAFQELGQLKSRMQFASAPGRIEVTHLPESEIYMTFMPHRGRVEGPSADIDPNLVNPSMTSDVSMDITLIDSETDDIVGKMELYCKRMAQAFYEQEISNLVKPTLELAAQLSQDKVDVLLVRTLELWISTTLMIDPLHEWQFFYDPSNPPIQHHNPTISAAEASASRERIQLTKESNPRTYNYLVVQLRAAAERRATILCKTVINELERRLLARHQAEPFQTWLIAVLLLNSFERLCAYFKAWIPFSPKNLGADFSVNLSSTQTPEPPMDPALTHGNDFSMVATDPSVMAVQGEPQQHQSADALSHILTQDDSQQPPQPSSPPPTSKPTKAWPVDRSPSHLIGQGERFADILHMLLKMRSIVPKTVLDPMTNVVMATEPASQEAKSWFENLNLTPDAIAARINVEGVPQGLDDGKPSVHAQFQNELSMDMGGYKTDMDSHDEVDRQIHEEVRKLINDQARDQAHRRSDDPMQLQLDQLPSDQVQSMTTSGQHEHQTSELQSSMPAGFQDSDQPPSSTHAGQSAQSPSHLQPSTAGDIDMDASEHLQHSKGGLSGSSQESSDVQVTPESIRAWDWRFIGACLGLTDKPSYQSQRASPTMASSNSPALT